MRISDWSSDVCSSDLPLFVIPRAPGGPHPRPWLSSHKLGRPVGLANPEGFERSSLRRTTASAVGRFCGRSEEHTSELQSLMRISYAVFCLKKKTKSKKTTNTTPVT